MDFVKEKVVTANPPVTEKWPDSHLTNTKEAILELSRNRRAETEDTRYDNFMIMQDLVYREHGQACTPLARGQPH